MKRTTMKRTMIKQTPLLFLLIALGVYISPHAFAAAAGSNNNIAITADNFPDQEIRSAISIYDENADGMLSDSENAKVTTLIIGHWEEDINIGDLSGLEKLRNLQILRICGYNGTKAVNINPLNSLSEFWLESINPINVIFNEQTNLEKLRINFVSTAKPSKEVLENLEQQISELTHLTSLDCSNCGLTSLNLSVMVQLTDLNCSHNQLKTLDLSKLEKLTELQCENNSLKTIKFPSSCNIKSLDCGSNELSSLACSGMSKLNNVDFNGNAKLQSLSLKNCPQLTYVNVSNCSKLKTLNLTGSPKINRLYADQVGKLHLSLQTGQKMSTQYSFQSSGSSFSYPNPDILSGSKKGVIRAKKIGTAKYMKKATNDTRKWTVIVYPKRQTLISAKKRTSKSIQLQWKKHSGVTGYQIQYATNKSFTENVKSLKIPNQTKTTLKKLKKNRTYYIRIRSYKKTGGKSYFGTYSAVKKIKL